MNAKHTPGPWNINDVAGKYLEKLEITSPHGDNGTHVASVTVDKKSFTDEQAANAALITTAPDLLAALEVCERVLSDLPSTHKKGTRTRTAYELARAAIAKATGSQA